VWYGAFDKAQSGGLGPKSKKPLFDVESWSRLPFPARIRILFDNKFDLLAFCMLGYKIVEASDPNKGFDANATLTGERYDGEVVIFGLDAATSFKPIHDRHTQITQYEVEESRISRMKQVECNSTVFSVRIRALQLMQLNTEIMWGTCDGQRKFLSHKFALWLGL